MMTSVVAAGNGSLSNGFYRGIAPDANVVLVKLARTGRISDANIRDGLSFVLDKKNRYHIRVVNISAGGDLKQATWTIPIGDGRGMCTSWHHCRVCRRQCRTFTYASCIPAGEPAPSAIAVGGLDDQNSLNRARRGMYRSSYGPTVDGLQKPEVIAPSIWVPAPILPNTPTAQEAELLKELDGASDSQLHEIVRSHPGVDAELDAAIDRPVHSIRQIITLKMRRENVITKYYKYVDGTSFSAPIVSSVVAADDRSRSRSLAAADKTHPDRHGRAAAALRSR